MGGFKDILISRVVDDFPCIRDLPEQYVTADPDPIKLDDVTVLIKTLDGDIRI